MGGSQAQNLADLEGAMKGAMLQGSGKRVCHGNKCFESHAGATTMMCVCVCRRPSLCWALRRPHAHPDMSEAGWDCRGPLDKRHTAFPLNSLPLRLRSLDAMSEMRMCLFLGGIFPGKAVWWLNNGFISRKRAQISYIGTDLTFDLKFAAPKGLPFIFRSLG